ncbi:MAG: hypothetical protein ACYTF1_06370 [Planctomycetota bacterium]
MGIKLVSGGYWKEAFDSFQRCEQLYSRKESPHYLSSLIWQGHIHDVWGQRDQALAKYRAALEVLDQYAKAEVGTKIETYVFMQHGQWGIKLCMKWIKQRLEKPFTKDMVKK